MCQKYLDYKNNLTESLCGKEAITTMHCLRSMKVVGSRVQSNIKKEVHTDYYGLQEVADNIGP